jgi:hypothetical protein
MQSTAEHASHSCVVTNQPTSKYPTNQLASQPTKTTNQTGGQPAKIVINQSRNRLTKQKHKCG